MHLARFACTAAALLFALAACTAETTDDPGGGAGGNGTGTGSGAGGGTPWGAHTDVEAIFAKDCSQCHSDAWTSCWNDHAAAASLESAISSDAMPRGAPMAAADKAAVLAWLAAGAPCQGPEPDGGAGSGAGGGAPHPIGEGRVPPAQREP